MHETSGGKLENYVKASVRDDVIWMKRIHILKVEEEPADFLKWSRSQTATSCQSG